MLRVQYYLVGWRYGLVVLALVAAFVVLLVARLTLAQVWRRFRWPEEARRRQGFARVVVAVESLTRVTDWGDVQLVLRVPMRSDSSSSYRAASQPADHVRLRVTVRLPLEAIEHIAGVAELPIRRREATLEDVAIDFGALMGERGRDIERSVYVQWGTLRGKIL